MPPYDEDDLNQILIVLVAVLLYMVLIWIKL